MWGEEQRVEPGDERSAAIETATRVGGEELARIGAAPVRCEDGNIRVVLADATPERIAGIREHFSGGIEIGVVTPSTLASLLDAASIAAVSSNNNDSVASGAAA